MAGQEQQRPQTHEVEDDANAGAPTPPPAAAAADFEVDSLLDEIDDVLEVNAESFVKGFVQKGGQ